MDKLKPFLTHGIELHPYSDNQYRGECIFCGSQDHFYVNKFNGCWDCKYCGESGNIITFLGKFIDSLVENSRNIWRKLAMNRNIPIKYLKKHKLVWNNGEWLLPCFSLTGTIRDIRRFDFNRTISTGGCNTQLYRVNTLKKETKTIILCEGEWDAIAGYWLLNESGCNMDEITTLAVPGSSVFKDEWINLFKNKHVICAYDNDKAGFKGTGKIYKKLNEVTNKLEFIYWPNTVVDKYDLRDFVVENIKKNNISANETFDSLMQLKQSHHRDDSIDLIDKISKKSRQVTLDELIIVYEDNILITPDLLLALKLMLAICVANDIGGDPLWLYIVGPPGIGKTLLLKGFETSDRCIFRSTLSPHCLVSGYNINKDNDPSLLPKLKGKTFVAKDFTEILTLPENYQDEIFSTLRGAYDGSVMRTFGNHVDRMYKDCYFNMLAGVTNTVHGHKKAGLGERFLKLQLSSPDKELTNKILNFAMSTVGKEAEIENTLQVITSRFLTNDFITNPLPEIPEKYTKKLIALVQIIALLRAQVERDTRNQDIIKYRPLPESGTRLIKQLSKLSMALCILEGKSKVDKDIFEIIEKVAFDTAYGFHYDVIKAMYELGGKASRSEVAIKIKIPATTLSRRFEDLELLNVIYKTNELKKTSPKGGCPAAIFQLEKPINDLWEEITK